MQIVRRMVASEGGRKLECEWHDRAKRRHGVEQLASSVSVKREGDRKLGGKVLEEGAAKSWCARRW